MNKFKIIIEIIIVLMFFITFTVMHYKTIDDSRSIKKNIEISENGIIDGFCVKIEQNGYLEHKAIISIKTMYNNKTVNAWNTFIKMENRRIEDKNFMVSFCGEYVKIIIIDDKDNIVGIYRAYKPQDEMGDDGGK